MKQATQAKLYQLNKEFYKSQSDSFDSTRSNPWTGWQKLLPLINHHQNKNILDIGCGNGRFGRFLADNTDTSTWNYLGIDNSQELLNATNHQDLDSRIFQFKYFDLQSDSLSKLKNQKFDLIVNFGVMHHIPGFENRLKLLQDSADLLNPNGVMVVSYWQFAKNKRYKNKLIPWQNSPQIDKNDLEPNDFLLGWQITQAYRYCHFTSPEEINKLNRHLNLVVVDSFLEDGKTKDLNLYYLYHKS